MLGSLAATCVTAVPRTDDNWILTYTGQKFWPLAPRAEDVHVEDIAHSLSLMCRFTGHCHTFYSVADHAVRVSRVAEQMVLRSGRSETHFAVAREVALWGLHHDDSEAYLHDMPSPLKRVPGFGDLYREFEAQLMRVIIDRLGLVPYEPAEVKEADRILLNTEMRDLCAPGSRFVHKDRLSQSIWPLTSLEAETEYLRRHRALPMASTVESYRKVVNL